VNEETRPATPTKLQLSSTDTLVKSAISSITFYCDAMKRQHDAAVAGQIEPVHQLRVSSRRLRAAIELFSGVLYASALKIYRRDIPWIAGEAGAVRNCDVLEELFKERAAKLDVTLRNALGPIIEAIVAERKAAHTLLVQELSSKRYSALMGKLSSPPVKTARGRAKLGIAAPDLVGPMVRGIRKKGKKLAEDAPPEIFHKLRVRIKRLRYALDMLAPLAGKHHRKTLMRLEEMQELLGAYNDTVVAIGWLHSFAATSGAPPATILAAGGLIHSLGARARKLMRQGLKAWQRFERSGVLDDAVLEFNDTAEDLADAERKAVRLAAEQARASAQEAASDSQVAPLPGASVASAADPVTDVSQPADPPGSSTALVVIENAEPQGDAPSPPKSDDTEHAA